MQEHVARRLIQGLLLHAQDQLCTGTLIRLYFIICVQNLMEYGWAYLRAYVKILAPPLQTMKCELLIQCGVSTNEPCMKQARLMARRTGICLDYPSQPKLRPVSLASPASYSTCPRRDLAHRRDRQWFKSRVVRAAEIPLGNLRWRSDRYVSGCMTIPDLLAS